MKRPKHKHSHSSAVLKFLPFQLPTGLPDGSGSKESTHNAGGLCLIPGLGRYPGGEHSSPLWYSCLQNPHGQRSLVGYNSWGHNELDMTE